MTVGWNDPTETHIAGDGEVYIAPVGTGLPANTAASLNGLFEGLGFHDEDGLTYSHSLEITDHMAWQSKDAIRREVTSRESQVTFNLLQFNEVTLPLSHGGGEVVELGGGEYKYDAPDADDPLTEYAVVADAIDGDKVHRILIRRATIVDAVEVAFKRDEMSKLAVTLKALRPEDGSPTVTHLMNSAAYAAGS